MLSHDFPFLFGQWARLEQDAVWNCHLANIMQDGSASQVDQVCILGPQADSQVDRDI